jgi:hypothetical protein
MFNAMNFFYITPFFLPSSKIMPDRWVSVPMQGFVADMHIHLKRRGIISTSISNFFFKDNPFSMVLSKGRSVIKACFD